jgi:hypothetical protein
MSHIPTRSPEWKAHDNIGHAKNAVTQKVYTNSYGYRPLGASCDMHIFILEDGQYVPHWVIPEGMLDEDLPWRKPKKQRI